MPKLTDPKDGATRAACAFRTWAELMQSVNVNGYDPTLNRLNAAQTQLGKLLEQEGARVFWVGGKRHEGKRHGA
jgi:hypothetical protein